MTGFLTIGDDSAAGSTLNGVVTLFDQYLSPIASDDPAYSFAGLESLSDLPVTKGQIFYLQVSALDGVSTGGYDLSILTQRDDFGNTFTTADQLAIVSSPFTQAGMIDYAGDTDMFQFVAPVTGNLTIFDTVQHGSGLTSQVLAYDGEQDPLGAATAAPGASESRVSFNVVAGQTYYVEAGSGSGGSSIGAYACGFIWPSFR